MPIARPVKHESGDKTKPKAEYNALTGNDSVIYVDWGDAPYPSIGQQYDVTLYSPTISGDNPLLLAGHPVDVVSYAAALSDVPIDDASREAVKAAIGDGHWCELAIDGVQKFSDFAKTLGGVYGFLLRPNAATGRREFVATRVRPEAPQFAITDADRVSASEDGDGQPLVWAAEEQSVVNVVTFSEQRFRRFVYKTDEGDPPVHMIATATATIEGARGDTTVNGDRTVRFELPGQMMVRATDGSVAPLPLETGDPDAPGYAEAAGGVIVDYAGWGVVESQVLVDAASDAASAQVGDEGTLSCRTCRSPTPTRRRSRRAASTGRARPASCACSSATRRSARCSSRSRTPARSRRTRCPRPTRAARSIPAIRRCPRSRRAERGRAEHRRDGHDHQRR
jgi:hypothetical protein